ncbi:MAG: ComF family protein [Puniceicoccales bacterium]
MERIFQARSPITTLRDWTRAVVDVFYPRSCLLSGDPLGDGDFLYLADWVSHRLPVIRDPRCPTCGHPFFGELEENPVCQHCENLRPAFKEGRCGYLLKRDTRTLLHSLKYRKKAYLAPDIAKLLARAPGFLDFLEDAIIVPIPLHPKKLRKRGFNQTEEILRHLAPYAPRGLQVRPLLRRIVDTDSQTRADRRERMKRVKGAFALAEKVELPPNQTRCVIFDDVFTTGATLNTCSQILRKAGIQHIDVAAFAHG